MDQGESADPGRGTGPLVLVVDDDRICRGYCARVLAARGCRVQTAATAREARRLVSRETRVILCDLRLPDPDDQRALLTACGAHADRSRVALVLTSADGPGLRASAAPSGACVLAKPFDAAQLIETVARALRRVDHGAWPPGGVREEAALETDVLARAFCASLRRELRRLDRNITSDHRQPALEVLHRLRGGAAMSGYGEFAEHCRRLAEAFGQPPEHRAQEGQPPGVRVAGWAALYVDLLRSGEDVLDRRRDLTRRE